MLARSGLLPGLHRRQAVPASCCCLGCPQGSANCRYRTKRSPSSSTKSRMPMTATASFLSTHPALQQSWGCRLQGRRTTGCPGWRGAAPGSGAGRRGLRASSIGGPQEEGTHWAQPQGCRHVTLRPGSEAACPPGRPARASPCRWASGRPGARVHGPESGRPDQTREQRSGAQPSR